MGICGAKKSEPAENDIKENDENQFPVKWTKAEEQDEIILQLKMNRDRINQRIKTLGEEEANFDEKIKEAIQKGINFYSKF